MVVKLKKVLFIVMHSLQQGVNKKKVPPKYLPESSIQCRAHLQTSESHSGSAPQICELTP